MEESERENRGELTEGKEERHVEKKKGGRKSEGREDGMKKQREAKNRGGGKG